MYMWWEMLVTLSELLIASNRDSKSFVKGIKWSLSLTSEDALVHFYPFIVSLTFFSHCGLELVQEFLVRVLVDFWDCLMMSITDTRSKGILHNTESKCMDLILLRENVSTWNEVSWLWKLWTRLNVSITDIEIHWGIGQWHLDTLFKCTFCFSVVLLEWN